MKRRYEMGSRCKIEESCKTKRKCRRSLAAILLLTVLMMAMMTVLTGCGGDGQDGTSEKTTGGSQEGPVALGVVIGNHANCLAPDYSTIENWLEETIVGGGTIRAIVSDGNPYGMNAEIDNSVFQKSLTDSTRQRLIEENLTALKDAFTALTPKTAEVDTLAAIRQAAIFLQQAEEETKVLLILDSGLSTTGLLDFSSQPEMLAAEREDVVAALEKKSGLPDLSGVEVYMVASETDTPQQKLSISEQSGLKEIWKAVLTASGAAYVEVNQSIASSTSVADRSTWPEVSTIETSGDTGIKVNLRQKAEIFTEEELGFKADSDELLDESKAKAALSPVAEYMKENPENTIIVMGSTATAGEKVFCEELSLQRAKKVAQLLEELGADRSRIQTLGLGYEDPWHAEDLDASGKLIESAAKQNRKVMVMDAESSEAAKLA